MLWILAGGLFIAGVIDGEVMDLAGQLGEQGFWRPTFWQAAIASYVWIGVGIGRIMSGRVWV